MGIAAIQAAAIGAAAITNAAIGLDDSDVLLDEQMIGVDAEDNRNGEDSNITFNNRLVMHGQRVE